MKPVRRVALPRPAASRLDVRLQCLSQPHRVARGVTAGVVVEIGEHVAPGAPLSGQSTPPIRREPDRDIDRYSGPGRETGRRRTRPSRPARRWRIQPCHGGRAPRGDAEGRRAPRPCTNSGPGTRSRGGGAAEAAAGTCRDARERSSSEAATGTASGRACGRAPGRAKTAAGRFLGIFQLLHVRQKPARLHRVQKSLRGLLAPVNERADAPAVDRTCC